MNPPGVVQLLDALEVGGAERVALDLANALPRDRWRSWISTTRRKGPLAALIEPHVGQFHLQRSGTLDPGAIVRFGRFLRKERIAIVHAHSTSLFFGAAAAALAGPGVRVIWHAHSGKLAETGHSPLPYRIAFWKASAAIGVTEPLARWARTHLGLDAARGRYIANSVRRPPDAGPATGLPGTAGKRIILVANFRPEKNHRFVLESMRRVVDLVSDASLLLVGTGPGHAGLDALESLRHTLGLERHVYFLGHRADIHSVLKACDLAIIGSSSEGLPIALLEYGMARRAVVSTDVGQCAAVLAGGECGVLVPPGDHERFSTAVVRLLRSPVEREQFGERLYNRVQNHYSQEAVIGEVTSLYDLVLGRQSLR